MRVAIVGSRDYQRLEEVRQYVWECPRDWVIVSGGARGVDTTAVDEAKRLGMAYEVYLPDWGKRGRGAGIVRNREIVDRSDMLIAFWDGKSKGTESSIRMATERGMVVHVFRPDVPRAADAVARA